jgi:hypothetical protein
MMFETHLFHLILTGSLYELMQYLTKLGKLHRLEGYIRSLVRLDQPLECKCIENHKWSTSRKEAFDTIPLKSPLTIVLSRRFDVPLKWISPQTRTNRTLMLGLVPIEKIADSYKYISYMRPRFPSLTDYYFILCWTEKLYKCTWKINCMILLVLVRQH